MLCIAAGGHQINQLPFVIFDKCLWRWGVGAGKTFCIGSSELGQKKTVSPVAAGLLISLQLHIIDGRVVGISQVKTPQISQLFVMTVCSQDCCKTLVNFQSWTKLSLTIFCLFLGALMEQRLFGTPFSTIFADLFLLFLLRRLRLIPILFLCMWPILVMKFCCFVCFNWSF